MFYFPLMIFLIPCIAFLGGNKTKQTIAGLVGIVTFFTILLILSMILRALFPPPDLQ